MATIIVNSNLFEYSENGKGEPLVFVHGSASDYRTWKDQQENFAHHYRVINYSRRYHWPNKQITEDSDYSMLEHVDDLEALLIKLSAVPAHLVGHSYGAFLCLLLAIKNPDFVRTLVLAEPPVVTLFINNTPKPMEMIKLMFTKPKTAIAIIKFGAIGMGPAKAIAKRGDVRKAMRKFGSIILGKQFYNQLSESRLEQVDANAIKAEFLGSGFASLDDKQIRNIRIPTLLVTAQYSHNAFHRLIDRLEELLPNTERVEINNASHIMHEDNSLDFNKAVKLFLEKK